MQVWLVHTGSMSPLTLIWRAVRRFDLKSESASLLRHLGPQPTSSQVDLVRSGRCSRP